MPDSFEQREKLRETVTVLVADDDEFLLGLLVGFLKKQGYRTVQAEDGVKALSLFGTCRPDLVLMDAHMPRMDGFQACTEIRKSPGGAQVPIIMVTALELNESVHRAFASGAEEYVTKPVNLAVLQHRLAILLERRRMERTIQENEERFRAIAESAREAIISADETGHITFWNGGAAALFGHAPEEILGKPLETLIPREFQEAHRRSFQAAAQTGRMQLQGKAVELFGVRKDGTTIPIEASLSTWSLQGRRYFSTVIRDITERLANRRRKEASMQSQLANTALLETTLEPLTMTRQLEVALDIITTVPWIGVQSKGMVLLRNPTSGRLEPASHREFSGERIQSCVRFDPDRCLCGRAVQTRAVVAMNPEEIAASPPPCHDRTDAGHYCVPILSGKRPLGVLKLFVREGRACNPEIDAFLTTVGQTLAAVIERRRMEAKIAAAQQELRETRLDIIRRLGVAAEYRDTDTGEHIVRMSQYAALLGQAMGLSAMHVDLLLHATPMHDVGKIGIPDHILLKPGRLTPEEFGIIKTHTTIGASMLYGHENEPLNTAHIIALTHHEKWDGSGYPHGLAGKRIPVMGRICALVDVFDALTMDRPYKRAWHPDEALLEIERGAGSHFDPQLVVRFKGIFPEILRIKAGFETGTAMTA